MALVPMPQDEKAYAAYKRARKGGKPWSEDAQAQLEQEEREKEARAKAAQEEADRRAAEAAGKGGSKSAPKG